MAVGLVFYKHTLYLAESGKEIEITTTKCAYTMDDFSVSKLIKRVLISYNEKRVHSLVSSEIHCWKKTDYRQIDRRADRPTDGRTHLLIEMHALI